jgi:hypothetical protein
MKVLCRAAYGGQNAVAHPGEPDDAYRRRRLRLGALLYQLGYFAVVDRRDALGEIVEYRLDAQHWVEVDGTAVRLVGDQAVETLDLEAAILRCLDARSGQSLHHGDSPGIPS